MSIDYLELFEKHKETKLHGRYISLKYLEPILLSYHPTVVGSSVKNKPIYQLVIGTGKEKILMWSQMHGNESTTTKALMDLIAFLYSEDNLAKAFLERFTLCLLPMLNPDGAEVYTRENANGIDLNRDAQNLSQPESKVLRKVFNDFEPHYCYNLHDQRTIFGAGNTGKPATVSFLAPSFDEERSINEVRARAMEIIVGMHSTLQEFIPGQVGIFDDSFNLNCVGDTFQNLGVPTILFEAGHFPEDYEREETRKYIFISLLRSLLFINENEVVVNKIDNYLKIPQNFKSFYDLLCKNVEIYQDNNKKIINFAIQRKEILKEDTIVFESRIEAIHFETTENYFGHQEIDAQNKLFSDDEGNIPILNKIATFKLGETIRVENGKIVR